MQDPTVKDFICKKYSMSVNLLFKADMKIGMAIAKGLGVDVDSVMNSMNIPSHTKTNELTPA